MQKLPRYKHYPALDLALIRHNAGRPDWLTADVLRRVLRTGQGTASERGAIRETFQTVDQFPLRPPPPTEIQAIVREEGLDPGATRLLFVECGVTNPVILNWLLEQAPPWGLLTLPGWLRGRSR